MRTTAWLLVGLTTVVACGGEGGEDRVDDILALDGDAAAGDAVYAAECSACHGAAGEGGSGPAMSEVAGEGAAEIVEVVLNGDGDMPAFPEIPDQDIADLVAYILDTY